LLIKKLIREFYVFNLAKKFGTNMIYYKNDSTEIGLFTYVASDEALIALKLPSEDIDHFLDRISKLNTSLIEKDNHELLILASQEIRLYLQGKLKEFSVPVDLSYLSISEFQVKVWKEISRIEFGKTTTYKKISDALNTKGYQAVGNATGNNPIPVIVGCHRVLATEGIGGFSGGIELKKTLLSIESNTKKKKINDFF
jgi:methylated-DNA-[protein]-cysteine S-methyltransferase